MKYAHTSVLRDWWILHIPLFNVFDVSFLSSLIPTFITTILEISIHLLWILLSVTSSKKSSIRSLWLLIILALIHFVRTIWSVLKFKDDENDKDNGNHSSCYDTNDKRCILSCLWRDAITVFAVRLPCGYWYRRQR